MANVAAYRKGQYMCYAGKLRLLRLMDSLKPRSQLYKALKTIAADPPTQHPHTLNH